MSGTEIAPPKTDGKKSGCRKALVRTGVSLLCVIALVLFALWLFLPAKYTLETKVRTVDGEVLPVVYQNRACIYWAFGHLTGGYVYPGFTRVAVTVKGRTLRFVVNEDQCLVGVNIFDGRCFLIFKEQYESDKGGYFLYSAPVSSGEFVEENITKVPPRIAYRNVFGLDLEYHRGFVHAPREGTCRRIYGSEYHEQETALSVGFLNSDAFLMTHTAGLWSQAETGEMYASYVIKEAAVERFKQKFLAARNRMPSP
ncbi:MAG: hypothetical protein NT105_18735 [Verrucomicrobia bacterium]|nr:hypothetical protein [Verrucomicrobiota bacterium]